ncbi:MAG: site-specific integrase [Lachnospiraceae bacterium]|nr:site-specific integrase [Lachnospiraceae bacterium]
MNMTSEDISNLLYYSNYCIGDTPSIISAVYSAGLLAYGRRRKYLARHVKSNGRPKAISRTKDGKYYAYFDRKMIKRNKKEQVETELVRLYGGEQQLEHYLDDLFKEWISLKKEEGDITSSTVNRYHFDYRRFFMKDADYVREFKGKTVQLITAFDIEHFIKMSIKTENLTAKGFSNLRLILRGMFVYARKKRYTNLDINSFFDMLSLSKNVFRKRIRQASELVFNSDEIKLIRDHILNKSCDMRSLCVLLAFECGARSGELVSLRWEDVEGDILHICRTEITHLENDADGSKMREVRPFTKGHRGYRDVILSKSALETLERIAKISDGKRKGYIFVEDGKRLHAEVPSIRLQQICRELGIRVRSLNKCRKTYASYLKAMGVSDSLIEDQMGHTSISTTEIYYIFDTLTRQEAKVMIENAIKF